MSAHLRHPLLAVPRQRCRDPGELSILAVQRKGVQRLYWPLCLTTLVQSYWSAFGKDGW